MKLQTTSYLTLQSSLPTAGKHVVAQYDDDVIVVYQAYNRTVAAFAARHGHFGDGFSFARMSWIKPNFLHVARDFLSLLNRKVLDLTRPMKSPALMAIADVTRTRAELIARADPAAVRMAVARSQKSSRE